MCQVRQRVKYVQATDQFPCTESAMTGKERPGSASFLFGLA